MRLSRTIAPFAFVAFASFAAPIYAQSDDDADARRYGRYYNGSFVDIAARAALTDVTSANYGGWSYDVGLRQAFPMHLLDTRLAFVEDRFTPRGDSATGTFVVRSVGVWTALHPLYLALLLSDRLGYLIASLYLELGLAGQYATLEEADDFGLRFSVGGGFDVPLSDPDRGWSIWLNALYRYTWADFDFDTGGEVDLYHHAGWLGCSLRFNGLIL